MNAGDMVQLRVSAYLQGGTTCAETLIFGSDIHLIDTGMDDGAGTHGAWFFGDVDTASIQPFIAGYTTCFFYGHHLGVTGGVLQFTVTVHAGADDDPAAHYNRT